jgi:hypothetical protein
MGPRPRLRSQVTVLIVYGIASLALGILFYTRWKWAYPDVPYLTNLTSLDVLEPALSGDLGPLWESFSRFDGEHKLWIYYIYLYLNARLFEFSTISEITIWTISLFVQTMIIGIYLVKRFNICILSLRFLLILLVPALVLSTAFSPGRGMETQIQLSTTALVIIMLIPLWLVRTWIYTVSTVALTGIYVVLLSGAYFGGGAFALVAGSLACIVPGVCSSSYRNRVVFAAACTTIWGAIYMVMLARLGSPSGANTETLASLLRDEPLFAGKYVLAGLAGTVMTSNTAESTGSETYPVVVYMVGGCVAIVAIILLTIIFRSHRARRHVVFPLMLVAYGIGVTLTIMYGRYTDSLWILNMWYSFHFRLLAEGIVVALVTTMSFDLWRRKQIAAVFCAVLFALVLMTYSIAARHQWQRNVHERAYFGNIREYVLETDPQQASRSTEMSPIYLGPEATARALLFLRHYRFSPFNSE